MKLVKSLLLTLILATSLTLSAQVFAEQPIKVFIDSYEVDFPVPPVMQNDTTLVPFRAFFEKLDLKVTWDERTQTVTGIKDGLNIQLKIGDMNALVNGKATSLDVAPTMMNDYTYVPLRFIGESVNGEVLWFGETKEILISTILDEKLLSAVLLNDAEGVKSLIKQGANPNYVVRSISSEQNVSFLKGNITGRTVLELSVGHNDALKALLDSGADPNTKNALNNTPLHFAAHGYDPIAVKYLIDAKADINIKNHEGNTALIFALDSYKVATESQKAKLNTILSLLGYDVSKLSNKKNPTNSSINDINLNVTWGTSEADIKLSRTDKPYINDIVDNGNKRLVYKHEFDLGETGRIIYIFDSKGLTEVMLLVDENSEFYIPFSVYVGQTISLSDYYNNGEIPANHIWKADSITIQAYKNDYGDDVTGMWEMAIRSDDMTLGAKFNTKDTIIVATMFNAGTFEKPNYMAGVVYTRKIE